MDANIRHSGIVLSLDKIFTPLGLTVILIGLVFTMAVFITTLRIDVNSGEVRTTKLESRTDGLESNVSFLRERGAATEAANAEFQRSVLDRLDDLKKSIDKLESKIDSR